MKNYILIICLLFSFVACNKESKTIISNGVEFDSLEDPEGTHISMVSGCGNYAHRTSLSLDAGPSMHCDDDNMMYCLDNKILIVGRVAGLAQITQIPSSPQWESEVSVIPGYGYIVRWPASNDINNLSDEVAGDGYKYGRLYCIYSICDGGKILNYFKHQSPFIPSNIQPNRIDPQNNNQEEEDIHGI